MKRTEKNTSKIILLIIDVIALILILIFWLLSIKYNYRGN